MKRLALLFFCLALTGCASVPAERPLPAGYSRGNYATPPAPGKGEAKQAAGPDIILIYQRPEARDYHDKP